MRPRIKPGDSSDRNGFILIYSATERHWEFYFLILNNILSLVCGNELERIQIFTDSCTSFQRNGKKKINLSYFKQKTIEICDVSNDLRFYFTSCTAAINFGNWKLLKYLLLNAVFQNKFWEFLSTKRKSMQQPPFPVVLMTPHPPHVIGQFPTQEFTR